MLIDLHSHSTVSDGTTSPAELVRHAAEVGLDVIGLTDHDTAAGWPEARSAAAEVGVCLVPGMEISTKLGGRSVHLLAYLPDPSFPVLAAELTKVMAGRGDRLPAMLRQLAAADRELTEEEVHRQVGEHGVVGRPHVADAMVAKGFARDRGDAFERWLNPGRAGFVVRYAPGTTDMVRIVAAAGGAAVIAHPWARNSRQVLSSETLSDLRSAGLTGIEVDHQDHPVELRAELRRLAGELGLVATGSSDYHGAGKIDHELGVNVTAPVEFERLIAAAAANAAASGRDVPMLEGLNPGRLR